MKKMKQLLMLFVAFALVVSSGAFSVSVLAEDTVVSDKSPAVIKITEADMLLVEKLEALGIVKDINADLTAKVTRREMAELVADYLRLPNASVDLEVSPFADVPLTDSAINAITALYNMQIITGDDMKKFYPDANLNYDEALVFIVNAVGYKLFAARDGGFPTGYHRIAIQLGLLKELSMQSGRDEITRLDVYKLMEAGLRAAAVTYDGYTENTMQYTISTTNDFLSNTHGITTHKGIITGNEDTYLTNATSKLTDEQIEIDHVIYDTPGYAYATSLGRSVIYYLKDDNHNGKEIVYIEENDALNNVVKVDARDIVVGKTTNSRIYYTDENEKEYHLELESVDVIYNGRAYRGYGSIMNAIPAAGYIEALDNNGDDVADILFVYAYRNVIVNGIDTYTQEIITSTGERILCDIEGGNARVYRASEMSLGDLRSITVGGVASVMESKGTPTLTTIYASSEKVNGTISEVLSNGAVIIDGVKYTKAIDYAGITLTAGTAVSLSLDFNGQIAHGDYGANKNAPEIGVLAGLEYEQGALESKIQIRLYTKAKKFMIYELNNPVRIDNVRYYVSKPVDMENILKLLSENQKENSRYSITEARLIAYRVKDNKITEIDAGGTGVPGNLKVIVNRSNYILSQYTSQVLDIKKEDGSRIFGIYDRSKIAVFAAPYNDPATAINEVSGTSGYTYGLTLEQKIYTTQTGTDYTYTRNTALYSLSDIEGVNQVDALLFRGSARAPVASTSAGIGETSSYYLITKITEGSDSFGTTTKKFHFGSSSKLLAEEVRVINRAGQHFNLTNDSPIVQAIKPGYVIQYGLDSDGKIGAFRVISDFDEATGNVKQHYNYAEFPKGTKHAAGVITNVSPSTNSVIIDAWNPSEGNYLGRITGKIYIYHSAEKKLVPATVAELKVGDKITAHIQAYHNLTEIFIIR